MPRGVDESSPVAHFRELAAVGSAGNGSVMQVMMPGCNQYFSRQLRALIGPALREMYFSESRTTSVPSPSQNWTLS